MFRSAIAEASIGCCVVGSYIALPCFLMLITLIHLLTTKTFEEKHMEKINNTNGTLTSQLISGTIGVFGGVIANTMTGLT